jgi:hypothetical protein
MLLHSDGRSCAVPSKLTVPESGPRGSPTRADRLCHAQLSDLADSRKEHRRIASLTWQGHPREQQDCKHLPISFYPSRANELQMLTISDLSASFEALRIQHSQQPVSALKWKYVFEQSQLVFNSHHCRTSYSESAPCLHCRRSLSLLPNVGYANLTWQDNVGAASHAISRLRDLQPESAWSILTHVTCDHREIATEGEEQHQFAAYREVLLYCNVFGRCPDRLHATPGKMGCGETAV